MNISSTIKSIQDIMRKDDGVDGDAQRLGQLTWMLFLKVYDQREQEWEDDHEELGKVYVSPIPEKYRWRNWAAYILDAEGKKQPQIQASELIEFINNGLFPALKDEIDPARSKHHKVVREVFQDANNFMKSGTLMLEVIEKLEDAIDFDDFTNRTQLGTVYEQLLNDLRGAGNAGEFYTPRAVTDFMMLMIDPRLDKKETVLDPACGTGGFLTAAINHFKKQINNQSDVNANKTIESLIHGIEKKQLPHLLCSTNMLLHGIEVPDQITHQNTLGKGWNDWSNNERVDCVVTNPPFGGYEEDSSGSGYKFPTRETADLFMQLIIKKLLKQNGRAAVVLPDGFLFGDGIKARIKEALLRECNLHTIIRLPKGVFAPYTTIKTNLLFFTRKHAVGPESLDEADNNSEDDATLKADFSTDTIWFYEHPYPHGYKSYSKTKPIQLDEFLQAGAEKDWWGNETNGFADREENERAWKVDFRQKRTDALNKAQPHWQKAEQLNNQAQVLEAEAKDLRNSLKGSTDTEHRAKVNVQIEELLLKAEPLRLQARDAQAAGDREYWPIYNLDLSNPNAPEQESHDPDILLEKYHRLLSAIEETENSLKAELAAALSHHFADSESSKEPESVNQAASRTEGNAQ